MKRLELGVVLTVPFVGLIAMNDIRVSILITLITAFIIGIGFLIVGGDV